MNSISRMQELLQGFSRGAFDRFVEQTQADKHAKGFGSWGQLVAMLYAQLSGASSLRELETGFNAVGAHHYHLGVKSLRRSTLADANARRSPEVFARLCSFLMAGVSRRRRRDAQDFVCLLDSTPISLMGQGFDEWTSQKRTSRTQGLKLHLAYAPEGLEPLWQEITAANVNDITVAQQMPLMTGTTYVFDKGYCDYNWWAQIEASQSRFVTRFKCNVALEVLQERPIEAAEDAILHDQLVRFTHRQPRGGKRNQYGKPLRRIEVQREGKPPLVLATNDLHSPAAHIAQHYKQRWQVELFFKWIKQHLRVKSFLGRSENAVRTQLLIALIAYLLLALYRARHGVTKSLWSLLAELRSTLFQRPELERLLHHRRREAMQELELRQQRLFA